MNNVKVLVDKIQEWRQVCSDNHEMCRTTAAASTRVMPTRLLDLAPDAPCLIETCILNNDIEYAALSYCWGSPQRDSFDSELRTTNENLHLMQNAIRIKSLGQTLQDAIEIVKRLGFRYLWIDALCIVQGNLTDWDVESRNMGAIYSIAAIVISAVASHNTREGIFRENPHVLTGDNKDFDNEIEMGHDLITACRTKPQEVWETEIKKHFPLLTRGWAFQERLTPMKLVHFGRLELTWECKTGQWCQCSNFQLGEKGRAPKTNLHGALQLSLGMPFVAHTIRRPMWREIVKSYSRRSLTNREYRLTALYGLAQIFGGTQYESMYLAGLWRNALPYDLMWRCDQSSQLSLEKPRGPSWSWASIDCGINWAIFDYADDFNPLKYISSETFFERSPLVRKDETKEIVESVDAGTAKIVLNTRMITVSVQCKTGAEKIEKLNLEATNWIVRERDNGPSLPFYPDIEMVTEDAEYKLLETVVGHTMGLVVRPSSRAMGCFERIGVAGEMSCHKDLNQNCWFQGKAERFVII